MNLSHGRYASVVVRNRQSMTPFRSSLLKKIQAAGVILRDRGPMDRLRLLKLLYIADREALQERGVPIIGGLIVAMKHGPLHSEVYDLIKGAHVNEADWSAYIISQGNTITLKSDPGRLDISPYEIDKLNAVTDHYQDLDTWELSELTHDFEEWKDSFVKGASRPISSERLLKEVGFSDDEIAGIVNDANAHSHLFQHLGA